MPTAFFPPRSAPARLLGFLLLFLFMTAPNPLQALERNTIFIPFKINAPEADKVANAADKALEQAARSKGFTVLSRSEAKKRINYDGAWPPPVSVLRPLAEAEQASYVVVGSVNQLGNRLSLDSSIFDTVSTKAPHNSFREGDSLKQLGALTKETVAEMLGYSNQRFSIASIAPSGNERIDSAAILQKISSKPGDVYDPAALRQDIKSVFSMGYFDDVQLDVQDSPQGKKVVFLVQEKPLIGNVLITGAESISEEEVREAAKINANAILDPAQVNAATTRIKDLYKSKGYYTTEVTSSVNPTGAEGAPQVHFQIIEGGKVTIETIDFTGNNHFSAGDLEDVIQTGTHRWWLSWLTGSGILKMDVLRQDAERVAAFYQNHGFIEAKVGEPQVERREDKLYITFPVDEGPRYKMGSIDIQGDMLKDKEELMKLVQVDEEEYFNRQILREDMARLTDVYAEQGYAYAEVTPQMKQRDAEKKVDVVFKIEQGALVYINRVQIQGNTRTRDNVIRRDLKIQEGEKFDSKAIKTSNQKLNRLGFFESVSITPKPTMREDLMDVLVDVKEKSTGQFSIGAGYSSADHLMFMGEISENNLFGTGNRLSLQANTSSRATRYNLNFMNPRLYDSEVSGSFNLYNWRRKYDDYTRDSIGGGVRIGHPLFEEWRISYGYSLSNTDLTDISPHASPIIVRSKDIHLTSAADISLVRDTRDKTFSPTSGSRNSLSVEYAGGILGGDAQYTKLEGSSSWYFPMVWSTVFHVKAVAGKAFENEAGKLPVYEHFYLGGMNSIRGFKSASISPLDVSTHERIGGDKMWFVNLGIIFPLVKDMGIDGELFTDFGNVYAVEEDWDFGDYKKTAGFGVNWASPLGPLRLAFGYNLDRQPGEDSSNWDFSLGGTF